MPTSNFLSHYKCGCENIKQCNCTSKKDVSQIFMDNINDIAQSLVEVMIVCGIHPAKARATGPITVQGFLHYDEERHRLGEVPRKRFNREIVFFLLAKNCLMGRMEAQLAYSIMKRAFKAFYHGTDVGGLRNPILEAQLIHSNECFWVHAANRTAQIFAQYEGLLKSAEKVYANKIKCIYKKLYDRMVERADGIILNDRESPDCIKKIIKNQQEDRVTKNRDSSTVSAHGAARPSKVEFSHHVGNPSTMTINIPQCYKCNCPKLVCECDIHVPTGVLTTDCSEGPFICRWVKDTDEENFNPCIPIPEDHECPVDCYEIGFACDSECDCDCEDCECMSCETMSVYEEYDYTDQILTEQAEDQTDDFEAPSIDMTPMYLRKPHPAFDCCRVAPPATEKKRLQGAENSKGKSLSSSSNKSSSSKRRSSNKPNVNKQDRKLSPRYQSVVDNLNQIMKTLF